MARALKYAIQIFWGIFGLYALLALMGLVGTVGFIDYRFVTHPIISSELLGYFFFLPLIALLVVFVYTAFLALFRFSLAIISPTVLVISLEMFMTALHQLVRYSQPMMEQRHSDYRQAISSFIFLMLLLVMNFGAVYFYRFTVAAIRRMLFPELNHSAARIF